jgi:hypothetical protein
MSTCFISETSPWIYLKLYIRGLPTEECQANLWPIPWNSHQTLTLLSETFFVNLYPICKLHRSTAFIFSIWNTTNDLTRWTAVILVRMIPPQMGNKFTFSETEGPFPRLTEFAIRPCFEAGNPSSHLHVPLHFKIHFILPSHVPLDM